jgi:hypothetical protein
MTAASGWGVAGHIHMLLGSANPITCRPPPPTKHPPQHTIRSPVLSSVNEAINGLATIRAFGIGPWLIARNRALVDANASTSLLNQSLNRWLGVRLEGLGECGAMRRVRGCAGRHVLVCGARWLAAALVWSGSSIEPSAPGAWLPTTVGRTGGVGWRACSRHTTGGGGGRMCIRGAP